MIRRLLRYLARPQKVELLVGFGFLWGATFVDLLQPWPVKWLVDHVFGEREPSAWLGWIWPALSSRDAVGGLLAVCVSILLLALAHRLGVTAGHFFLIRAGARLVQRIRCQAWDHLHRLSLAYHDRTKVGDSLYRVAYDSHAAQALLNGAVVPCATGVLLLIGAVVIMLQLNVILTLTTMAAAPLFVLIIRGFSRRIDCQSRQYHEKESALFATAQESLSSIRAIQAFTLEPQTAQRFRDESQGSLEANEEMTRTQLTYSACAGLAVSIGTAAVVWVAGQQVLEARLTVGDILVFLAYLGMLYQPMNTFSQSASVIQSSKAQLRRVFEIIDAAPDIQDRPTAVALPRVAGRMEFRNVSFGYDLQRLVLRNLTFAIEPGQVVAAVGRTGAGKTTAASLMLRFYDPTGGSVHLDGHDLRDLKIAWLRRQISVVLQDPILFSSTVAENILYGRPDATLEEIRVAAQRAQADEFIRALPHGYETLLGERGVNLSGGQRQRLSIARAFLKNAPVLILDEPTSALDPQTEEALLVALGQLTRNRTTFVIAHRLSTVRRADKIFVLENGSAVEVGTHRELMSLGGVYARLCRSQWGQAADLAQEKLSRSF